MRLYDVGRLRAEDIEDVDGEDEDDVDDERDDNDDDDDGDDDAVAINGSDEGERESYVLGPSINDVSLSFGIFDPPPPCYPGILLSITSLTMGKKGLLTG